MWFCFPNFIWILVQMCTCELFISNKNKFLIKTCMCVWMKSYSIYLKSFDVWRLSHLICTLLCLPIRDDLCIFLSFYTMYHQTFCLQLILLPMLCENIIIPSLTYIPITIGYHNGLVCYHWLPRISRVTSGVTHIEKLIDKTLEMYQLVCFLLIMIFVNMTF